MLPELLAFLPTVSNAFAILLHTLFNVFPCFPGVAVQIINNRFYWFNFSTVVCNNIFEF
jgi:hypothetical protein